MINILIEFRKGNINPVLDHFGFDSQNCILPENVSETVIARIFREIYRHGPKEEPGIRLAVTRSGDTRFFDADKVILIESRRNIKHIIFENDSFDFYGDMDTIARKTEYLGFLRVHHSFIISTKHIAAANCRRVIMDDPDHTAINIGEKYLPEYRNLLKKLKEKSLN